MGRVRTRTAVVGGVAVAAAVLLILQLLPGGPNAPDLSLLDAVRDTRDELEFPGIDVESAAENLGSVEAALAFVRDEVVHVPYAGRMLTPEGVLGLRSANMVDRAALLAALLEELGYEAHVVQASEGPPGGGPEPGDPSVDAPTYGRVAELVGYSDSDRETDTAQARRAFQDGVATIQREVEDALDLLTSIGALDPDASVSGSTASEQDWFFVQARRSDAEPFEDFDPNHPDAERPSASQVTLDDPVLELAIDLVSEDGRITPLAGHTGVAGGQPITVSFEPAAGGARAGLSELDPGLVDSWIPVLHVGRERFVGRPVTADGEVVPDLLGSPPVITDEDGDILAFAPDVRSLEVVDVDAAAFPEVLVTLEAEPMEEPAWVADHFRVTDAGEELSVRIRTVRARQAPIVLVIDTSGSMVDEDRYALAREAARGLIERLGPRQRLGAITFGGSVTTVLDPSPVSDPDEVLNTLLPAIFPGGNTPLLEALEAGLAAVDGPGWVVFLTDGVPDPPETRSREEEVLEAVRQSEARVIPVGIGEADERFLRELADASGTEFVAVASTEALPDVYSRFGESLSGRVAVTYEAPDGDPGEARDLAVRLDGFDGEAPGSYRIPSEPQTTAGRVVLTVRAGDPNDPVEARTTLADLGIPGAHTRLDAVYEIAVSPGLHPESAVAARYFDGWLEAAHLQSIAAGETFDPEVVGRGPPFELLGTVNDLTTFVNGGLGEGMHPPGPTILLRSSSVADSPDDEQVEIRTSLDAIAFGGPPVGAASLGDAARWGLAVAGAEAQALGTASVNARLLEHRGSLEVVRPGDDPPEWVPDVFLRRIEDGGTLVVARDDPEVAWMVDDGGVRGLIDAQGAALKGATDVEIAERFSDVRKRLARQGYMSWAALELAGVGALSAMYGGIAGIVDEDLKLWCYSTIMLNYVGEAIETGDFDVRGKQGRAAELCEVRGSPEDYATNAAKAFIKGYAEAVAQGAVADGITNHLPNPGRWGAAGVAAGVGAFTTETNAGQGLSDALGNAIFS